MARVFVGLSGGVDSAVSAALLKEEGHDVTGVFIWIWNPEWGECRARHERLDAMRVAAFLGIPFREVDLSAEYEKSVIGNLIEEYRSGRTPNPDVLCNRTIKFGAFAEWALAEGAEKIATGHYARIVGKEGKERLARAIDREKDQSYFLWRLSEKDLARTLFPIGGLFKREVRALAQRFGLPVAEKPDSQGLCFIGELDMADFLKKHLRPEPGELLDEHGHSVGEHDGAALYTLGQRHGFRVRGAVPKPYFVIRTDTAANTVYVSMKKEKAYRLSAVLSDEHFPGKEPPFPLSCMGVVRYHGEEHPCRAARRSEELFVTFSEPVLLSPGQSLVFYENDTVRGGGVIRAHR